MYQIRTVDEKDKFRRLDGYLSSVTDLQASSLVLRCRVHGGHFTDLVIEDTRLNALG